MELPETKEQWKVISEFPNYSISSTWKIKNNGTGKLLKISKNGFVNFYSGSRSSRVSRGVYKLYLQYFCGCPSKCNGRTKIRVIETGEIFYGYKAVCDAIGVSYGFVDNICNAAYGYTKAGEKRSVNGYHFEVLEEGT